MPILETAPELGGSSIIDSATLIRPFIATDNQLRVISEGEGRQPVGLGIQFEINRQPQRESFDTNFYFPFIQGNTGGTTVQVSLVSDFGTADEEILAIRPIERIGNAAILDWEFFFDLALTSDNRSGPAFVAPYIEVFNGVVTLDNGYEGQQAQATADQRVIQGVIPSWAT